jgi:hypothetical protein
VCVSSRSGWGGQSHAFRFGGDSQDRLTYVGTSVAAT